MASAGVICSLSSFSRLHKAMTLEMRPGCQRVIVLSSFWRTSIHRYVSISDPDVLLKLFFKCLMMASSMVSDELNSRQSST
jgi:hypothetical protein